MTSIFFINFLYHQSYITKIFKSIRKEMQSNQETLKQVFDSFDKDGDGSISATEIQ